LKVPYGDYPNHATGVKLPDVVVTAPARGLTDTPSRRREPVRTLRAGSRHV
jgi:hypothetical protein